MNKDNFVDSNLKESHDYFEAEKLLTHVIAEEKLYSIHEVNE